MEDLRGKTAIVTGSSRGIGRAVALQLAGDGANVVVNYTRNRDLADALLEEIAAKGGKAISVKADVSVKSDVEALFQTAARAFGSLDILVNCAALSYYTPLETCSEEDYDRIMDVNVKGTFFACQQAMRYMASGGRIVNFSSQLNRKIARNFSLYCASKGAVEQLTRQLAKEFGEKGITINVVAPGPVATEMLRAVRTPAELEMLAAETAFGRIGEPEDLANVVEFLVSERSAWVTGQVLPVNGGAI